MRRGDLQAIAQAKLDDAILLLVNNRFSNAYYLAGYAVEIGLKACIARQIFAETIPDKNLIKDTYQHELRKLVGIAGLMGELKQAEQDPTFAANWAVVVEWNPEKRYEAIDALSAQAIMAAITNAKNGVFPWIRQFW